MSDYEILLLRLRAWLLDPEARVWTDDLLTEGLRQALSDLMQAAGERYTLNGLDGEAAPSTLPRDLWPLLLRGALGYALLGRAAARLEPFNLRADLPRALQDLALACLRTFAQALPGLAVGHPRAFQQAAEPPYPAVGWPLEATTEPEAGP